MPSAMRNRFGDDFRRAGLGAELHHSHPTAYHERVTGVVRLVASWRPRARRATGTNGVQCTVLHGRTRLAGCGAAAASMVMESGKRGSIRGICSCDGPGRGAAILAHYREQADAHPAGDGDSVPGLFRVAAVDGYAASRTMIRAV